MKRLHNISWDEYFMGIALISAQRSKDPSTQVGSCIVNTDKHIVSIGYNGLPTGCSDDEFPWESQGEVLETKYPYVCHAELNAIINSTSSLKGCIIYTTLFPCNECAKAIIQSGIRKIIYYSDKHHDDAIFVAARRLFDAAGVIYQKYVPSENQYTIEL